MQKKPLYTIGHGNRDPENFLSLLKDFEIEYLIDVRSQPFSKFNPSFNQNYIKTSLLKVGITYVFMGDTIGGRPKDRSCYDDEGKVNYNVLKKTELFTKGIERLKTAYKKGINVALMCSERNPCECHRSKLIGKVLFEDKIPLLHIDEHGKLKDQITVINELNKGLSDINLFGNNINSSSRNSYL